MNGPWTKNTPNRVTPLMVPVIVTWYAPGDAPVPTMKLPVIAPDICSVQPTTVIGKPAEIEQVVTVAVVVTEAVSVSEACTPTVAPTAASAGVKTTDVWLTTVRSADAESPGEVDPVTVTV